MQTSNPQPILASVDFSPESKAALIFASRLSHQEGRPLVVLHVMHEDSNSNGMYRRRTRKAAVLPMLEIAEEIMDEFISDVRREYAGDGALESAETMVVDGLPVTRIQEVARRINAGRIVVGGKEKSHLTKLLNGSVVDSLEKNSSVSVTVIHSNEDAEVK